MKSTTMTKTEGKKFVLELKAASSDLKKLARTPAPTTFSAAGESVYVAMTNEIQITADMIDQEIASLEEQISSVEDSVQLATAAFQNQMQQQQQIIQMMANISNILHDTAIAIIRKISG